MFVFWDGSTNLCPISSNAVWRQCVCAVCERQNARPLIDAIMVCKLAVGKFVNGRKTNQRTKERARRRRPMEIIKFSNSLVEHRSRWSKKVIDGRQTTRLPTAWIRRFQKKKAKKRETFHIHGNHHRRHRHEIVIIKLFRYTSNFAQRSLGMICCLFVSNNTYTDRRMVRWIHSISKVQWHETADLIRSSSTVSCVVDFYVSFFIAFRWYFPLFQRLHTHVAEYFISPQTHTRTLSDLKIFAGHLGARIHPWLSMNTFVCMKRLLMAYTWKWRTERNKTK